MLPMDLLPYLNLAQHILMFKENQNCTNDFYNKIYFYLKYHIKASDSVWFECLKV